MRSIVSVRTLLVTERKSSEKKLKFGSCRPYGVRVMKGKSLNKERILWLKEEGKNVGK